MDVLVPKLQTKNLRRAPDAAAYQLYRAAQEWDLVDPILIQDRQDLKSEHKWRDHIEPYRHQVQNLITFCRRLPVTLLADDVGLGKTISAGLVASELMSRNRISKNSLSLKFENPLYCSRQKAGMAVGPIFARPLTEHLPTPLVSLPTRTQLC